MVPTITLDPYSIEISSELTSLAMVISAPPERPTELVLISLGIPRQKHYILAQGTHTS